MAASIALGAMVPAPTSAATTVGVDIPQAANGTPIECTATWKTCVALHTNAGVISDGYVVPADGVITSWRTFKGQPGDVQLFVVEPDGTGGIAEYQQLPRVNGLLSDVAGPMEVPTRARVHAGDELGLYFRDRLTAVAADPLAETLLVLGVQPAEDDLDIAPGRVLLNATIEPDADADGYGDDTQDHCPGPKSIPCATLAFAADPTPATMPRGSVTQTTRITNSGPGHTHPTTAAEIRAPQGITATVGGTPCTQANPRDARLVSCPLGRMAPGQTAALSLTVAELAPGENRVSITVIPANTTGLKIADIFTGPNSTVLTIMAPEFAALEPRARIERRLKDSRLRASISCPAVGTQNCRVSVTPTLVRGDRVLLRLKRTTATVRRGATRTLRVPLPKRARTILRRPRVRARIVVARTDITTEWVSTVATARPR